MSWEVLNLRHLNSGGNGDLFIGYRSDNLEQVVVKYLREYHILSAKKAFAREVKILRLGLPGVARLLAEDMNAKPPYYVMPYLGHPLTRHAGRLTYSQLQAVTTDLSRTLAALHAAKIIDGDFKPDNILVSQDGRLHVADPLGSGFGCTVLFSEHHGGTPGYWAPEVAAGQPISYAGDVYSFGATLYELLSGRKPQSGQRLDLILEGYADAPKIRELIAICCQVDPGSRPSMQEVLRMLNGEQWAGIQVERAQRQGWVAATCLVGGALLLGAIFAQDGQ